MDKELTITWMGAEYELRGTWSESQDPQEHWCEEFEIVGPDGEDYTSEFGEVFERVHGCKSIREIMNAKPRAMSEVFQERLWEEGS